MRVVQLPGKCCSPTHIPPWESSAHFQSAEPADFSCWTDREPPIHHIEFPELSKTLVPSPACSTRLPLHQNARIFSRIVFLPSSKTFHPKCYCAPGMEKHGKRRLEMSCPACAIANHLVQ